MEVVDRVSGESMSPDAHVAAAIHALDASPVIIKASEWPLGLDELDSSGLYSWWVDDLGACELSAGLGLPVYPGRIYVGQTGATRRGGASSSATLRSRIGTNHLRGSIEGSTFRWTIAAMLAEQLSLKVTERKKLSPDMERKLSCWMGERLSLAVYPFADRDALGDLEARVVRHLDPPLNLEHCPSTELRTRLTALRRRLVT